MEKKEEKVINLEGLPTETSPYTQYKDLEDYKKQGYGTQGHLQPKPGHGAAASTDAPTLSGAAVVLPKDDEISSADAINRRGVP
ncbi:hypothetical protein OROGR_018174 [Orobanche gracilis]